MTAKQILEVIQKEGLKETSLVSDPGMAWRQRWCV
ncbi:ASXL3 isoform 13 [Pan troglodytes]|nr:ASXL3 isoform 11 [Pan troglodytes]PNI60547.1 ASXL3 isoform 13 [Pan troglodytes]PNJ80898.1 ASXL3 isoform 6 [Pongo abelii]PNJ80902.1 ASXL3 isoform 10 [Pongo abelii]